MQKRDVMNRIVAILLYCRDMKQLYEQAIKIKHSSHKMTLDQAKCDVIKHDIVLHFRGVKQHFE